MNSLGRDILFGARMLRKNLGFTFAAVAVLALGIGANAAIFSLVNAFLLKPLVMHNPAGLVGCYSRDTQHADYRAFSYPDYADFVKLARLAKLARTAAFQQPDWRTILRWWGLRKAAARVRGACSRILFRRIISRRWARRFRKGARSRRKKSGLRLPCLWRS